MWRERSGTKMTSRSKSTFLVFQVQEETVVRFYRLLVDYGKDSIDRLDQREKQLMEMQRKQQAELIR